MTEKERAARYRRLANDETYQEVMANAKENAASVFLNPNASEEAINEAHSIVRALNEIEKQFNSVFADESFFDKLKPKR